MLENMKQGVFTIDAEGKIYPEYSRHLEAILGMTSISGRDFSKLLFSNSDVTAEAQSQMKSIINASVGERSHTFFINSHLLVKKICKNVGNLEICLELGWDPLTGKDDNIEKIIVTVRDLAELRNLQTRAADADRLQLVLAKEHAVKVLVGGIAHEFNIPLAIILMSPDNLHRNLKGGPNLTAMIQKSFNMAQRAINRISSLNARLLELAELQRTGGLKDMIKVSHLIQAFNQEQIEIEVLPESSRLDDYGECWATEGTKWSNLCEH